jgi:hypothetical protein
MRWEDKVMLAWLGLLKPILDLLKGAGIIKDPAQEAALQQQLAEAAAVAQKAQADEFTAFLKATTPDANRVFIWANSMIAITRPAITWLVTGSIVSSFFIPGVAAKMNATISAFSNGGTAGLMILAIPSWWFLGRSAEKIFMGQIPAGSGNGNGADHAGPKPVPPALGGDHA